MMLRRLFFVFFLILFLCGSVAYGQFEVGSIVGVVTDLNGSRVPGAKIEVMQTSTGSSRITLVLMRVNMSLWVSSLAHTP